MFAATAAGIYGKVEDAQKSDDLLDSNFEYEPNHKNAEAYQKFTLSM